MAETNRIRCPQCGMCYEGDATASEVQTLTCQTCGSTVKLVEEDPEGMRSGALPPFPRLAALTTAILLCLLAVRFSFLAIPALGVLVYLVVEVVRGHRRQRTDRIALWNRLRDVYATLSERNKTLTDKLAQTQASLTDEIAATRQSLTDELAQVQQALNDATSRYEAIAPERRDRLATEIVTQQKVLGVLGDLTALTVEKEKLRGVIKELKTRIVSFEQEELLQSFGFYQPMYDCADSTAYRRLLDTVRDRQKQMVKAKEAITVATVFLANNDKLGNAKIARSLERLVLRAFNNECDATIDKVTFNNLDAVTARITKAYQDINDLCSIVGISISQVSAGTQNQPVMGS